MKYDLTNQCQSKKKMNPVLILFEQQFLMKPRIVQVHCPFYSPDPGPYDVFFKTYSPYSHILM